MDFLTMCLMSPLSCLRSGPLTVWTAWGASAFSDILQGYLTNPCCLSVGPGACGLYAVWSLLVQPSICQSAHRPRLQLGIPSQFGRSIVLLWSLSVNRTPLVAYYHHVLRVRRLPNHNCLHRLLRRLASSGQNTQALELMSACPSPSERHLTVQVPRWMLCHPSASRSMVLG